MLAHATPGELRARLDLSEARGGSYNRLAWFLVRRRAALPNPPAPNGEALQALSRRFVRAVALGMSAGEVPKTPAAADHWEDVYPRLSGPVDELGQNYLGRAHAHALRFALILATLDEAPAIDVPHLRAALALVAYVEASVRYIFGRTGDGLAAKLLEVLTAAGPQGLARTELRHAAGKPKAERFNEALADLEAARRVNRRKVDTLGRPSEVWTVAECETISPKRSKRPPGPSGEGSEAWQEGGEKGQEGTGAEGFSTLIDRGNPPGDAPQVGPQGLFDLPDLFAAQVGDAPHGDPGARSLVAPSNQLSDIEERAAIMQFDGGLSREEAERIAGEGGSL
jgi:hypothetical protein